MAARALTSVVILGALALFATSAAGQTNTSRAFGPQRCGPIDPAYVSTANATGGQVFPLSPAEASRSATLMTMSSGTETVLWETGALNASGSAVSIPIDTTITRVTVAFSFDQPGADMVLTDQLGRTVNAGTAAAETVTFNCVRVITVERPSTGRWTAHIGGAGRFWLVVHAKSELALDAAEFVKTGGRAGHEGLFRIAGQPLVGQSATLRARVTRDQVDTVLYGLVSMGGDHIQSLDLSPVTADDNEEEFVGEIASVPTTPFRVQVSGRDRTGAEYQRVSGASFQPAAVELVPPSDTITVERGRRSAFKVRIRNVGTVARFQLRAVGSTGLLPVDPESVQLASGESAEATVSIDVPVTALTRDFDIVITAEQAGAATNINSAIVRATVEPER